MPVRALYRFLSVLIRKLACMGNNKKTIATVVTTVSRLGGEDKNILQVFQQYIVVDFEPIAALEKHIIVYNASMAFARLDAADTSPASPREAGFSCLFQ